MKIRLLLPQVQAAALAREMLARGPMVASALLGLGLTLQATMLVKHALEPEPPAPTLPTATGRQGIDSSAAVVGAILNGNLFGQAPSTQVPVGPPVTERFTLVGTVATDEDTSGFAILSDKSGVSRLFRVGAEIQAGVNLLRVFRDHVIVSRGALEESLALPRASRRKAMQVDLDTPPAFVVRTAAEDKKFEPPPLPTAGALMQIMRLHPVTEKGRPAGLGVNRAAQARPWLSALGLQGGDIVVTPTNMGEILDTLAARKPLSLSVQRGGTLVSVQIDADRADAAAGAYQKDLGH